MAHGMQQPISEIVSSDSFQCPIAGYFRVTNESFELYKMLLFSLLPSHKLFKRDQFSGVRFRGHAILKPTTYDHIVLKSGMAEPYLHASCSLTRSNT
jgi:hypothetical protein